MKIRVAVACVALLAVSAVTGCASSPNGPVPTTQTVQIEQNVIGASQIALDDAQVTVAVLLAANKIDANQAARINSAIQYAQTLLSTWSQHVADPLAAQLQAEFQTAVANVNLLLNSSQAKLQATTQPSP